MILSEKTIIFKNGTCNCNNTYRNIWCELGPSCGCWFLRRKLQSKAAFMRQSCWDSFFDLPLEVRQADELQRGCWLQVFASASWCQGSSEPEMVLLGQMVSHPGCTSGASLLATCLQTHFCFFLCSVQISGLLPLYSNEKKRLGYPGVCD